MFEEFIHWKKGSEIVESVRDKEIYKNERFQELNKKHEAILESE